MSHDIHEESKQEGIHQKFYLPKVSDEKFTIKAFLPQKFVLCGIYMQYRVAVWIGYFWILSVYFELLGGKINEA